MQWLDRERSVSGVQGQGHRFVSLARVGQRACQAHIICELGKMTVGQGVDGNGWPSFGGTRDTSHVESATCVTTGTQCYQQQLSSLAAIAPAHVTRSHATQAHFAN
jgi:hypothetical protein